MGLNLNQLLPSEGIKVLLVLFLSFLIGLEREEHKASVGHYVFGGVRTFPLIGLIGYSMAVLSGGYVVVVILGFVVVAGFLLLSYQHKLASSGVAGVTSELSGLTTYLVGALVYYDHFWMATTLSVASTLLLELKAGLERLTKRIAPEEIFTFAQFLLLSAVILPILPNADFGPYRINPFKTWLVVVGVSAVSYGGYILQQTTKGQSGLIVAAILGGMYSSTATTVVLAKKASCQNRPHLFSGATLMASGIMYLRLAALLGLFNRALMTTLAPSLMVLAGLGTVVGWLWSRTPDAVAQEVDRDLGSRNPLELRAAFLFAVLFLAMLVATRLATIHLGRGGVYGLAALMGVSDVDPFVMGMTQAAGALTPMHVASASILIAAASNNFAKGIYASSFSHGQAGVQSLCFLVGLGCLGLGPLLWLS